MSYSKKSIWDPFSCCSITKVRECLCVLKQVLIVNLYNINIQNTIIKGGFQTWSYIKGFSFLIAFLSITHVGFFLTCVITLQSVTVMHTSRETVHKATCKNSTHLWWWPKLYCTELKVNIGALHVLFLFYSWLWIRFLSTFFFAWKVI